MMAATIADDGLIRFLSGAWGVWLRRLVLFALLLVLALQLAQLTWRLLPAADLPRAPAAQAVQVEPMVNEDDGQLDKIAAYHLFGKALPKPVATVTEPVEAPQTQLKLKLLGVIAGDNPERALAIIAEPNGNQDFYGVEGYAVNDTVKLEVPGGATIRQIFADRVILVRNGREESLPLVKEGDPGRTTPILSSGRSATSPQRPAYQPPTPRQRAALPRRR
ncbi:MAG: hypothetical protein KDH88_07095 [Chromatiales bacterium]|nr:hypothetical protein [Chromatiales bacterium]